MRSFRTLLRLAPALPLLAFACSAPVSGPSAAAPPADEQGPGGLHEIAEREGRGLAHEECVHAEEPAPVESNARELDLSLRPDEMPAASLLQDELWPGPVPLSMVSTRVFGAAVEDRDGVRVGSVEDAFIDPWSGAVRAIGVHTEAGSDVAIAWTDCRWRARGEGLVLALEDAALASPGPRDFRRLFFARDLEQLAGEILELGSEPGEGGDPCVCLKLREPANRYHRVLLAPREQLFAVGEALAVGQTVELSGQFTRDAQSRIFVAASISSAGATDALRGPAGEPLWRAEPAPPDARAPAAELGRSLGGVWMKTAGGPDLELAGFFIERTRAAVASVLLRIEGERAIVPWSELRFSEGEGWTVALDHEQVLALPRYEDPSTVSGTTPH